MIMDIMLENEEAALARVLTTGGNGGINVIHRVVDQLGVIVPIVNGVDVEIDVVVTHLIELLSAIIVAGNVWWSHVGWDDAKDIADCHFVPVHLSVEFFIFHPAEVRVPPGVTGNLMTRVIHSL